MEHNDDYHFETAWPTPSDAVRQEAVDFWVAESALSEGQAIERAAQLLIVCRDCSGEIAAISTAVPIQVESLGFACFYFRSYVGKTHRARGLLGSRLVYQLLRDSYQVLNDRHQRQIDGDKLGLYLEIENPSIRRNRKELIWKDEGATIVFIGIGPAGQHRRVWYFDDAKLPDAANA